MHFLCKCGKYSFHDNADGLYYKGRLIADQDWNTLWNVIEECVRAGDVHAVYDRVYDLFRRDLFQCPECGRLYIENDDYSFTTFTPNPDAEPFPGTDKQMLDSVYGQTWDGFLSGNWNDDPPKWVRHRGMITVTLGDDIERLEFDDYDAFHARFDALLAELRDADRIRSATLYVNGEKPLSWYRNQQASADDE